MTSELGRLFSARLEASSGLMAEGVPTNNQRGRISEPCRLWGSLDKARHIVPTALLVRVQRSRKGLYKSEEEQNTRPKVHSIISGSYCRRRRLTIFEPDEMIFGMSLTLLSLLTKSPKMTGWEIPLETYSWNEAKEKYRGMFEIQKSGDKKSSWEIGLDIRAHASPKVGQDQVSGGVSVLC